MWIHGSMNSCSMQHGLDLKERKEEKITLYLVVVVKLWF